MSGSASLTINLMLALAADSGPDAAEVLRRAEHCFAQGVEQKKDPLLARKHFAESAARYAELNDLKIRNADLYLNWGNAELLAGRVPWAILAYQRGLHLEPGRLDLVENLRLARDRVAYPSRPGLRPVDDDSPLSLASLWLPWLPGCWRGIVCVAAILFYVAACFAFMRWFILRPGLVPTLTLLLILLAGACGYLWYRAEARFQEVETHPTVVISQEIDFLHGNGPSYPVHDVVPRLEPGVEARLFIRARRLAAGSAGRGLGRLGAEGGGTHCGRLTSICRFALADAMRTLNGERRCIERVVS